MPYDNSWALTVLSPIKNGNLDGQSYNFLIRKQLDALPFHEQSPWAKVPNTYVARLYILNDVFYNPYNPSSFFKYQDPILEENLKSSYLAFLVHFHGGNLDEYLRGAWQNIEPEIRDIWQHCVAFDKVNNQEDFVSYIKKCQIKTTFGFNGSTDESLKQQLKALYLKQEFSKFVFANQGSEPAALQAKFKEFIQLTQPANIQAPSWPAGVSRIPEE